MQERKNLMKNKSKFTFLTLALAASLLVGACNSGPASSKSSQEQSQSSINPSSDSSEQGTSSSQNPSSQSSSLTPTSSSSSQPLVTKYTVNFVVDGNVVQSSQVEEGELAVYTGEAPTKASSGAVVYRFKGWDKDLTQPITADTTFTAVFEQTEYANEIVIDDFESYRSKGALNEVWRALGYNNSTGWTTETNAAVVLGINAAQGEKSLRFNAWENGVGYKFARDFEDGTFTKSANALKFNLMVPSINTVRILLYAKATIMGQEQVAWFRYEIKPTSSEYVEYTIPIADANWKMYGEAGKTFPVVADYIGIHQDDIVKHLTKIEYYIEGNDGNGGQPYSTFFDSLKFVTTEQSALSEVETMKQYSVYTGLLADKHTIKIELGNDNAATATVLDTEVPQTINGSVAIDENKNFTFTSSDGGATLVYAGKLVNGGQKIKFVSASGTYATAVDDMELNAVQVVDNFDQYTSDGKAYYQSNLDMSQRSGARGAYFSEYYSGGSHEYETFGGDGWVLMGGNGDQLKLKTDGGHSGRNYLCMKNSASFAMRYLQWGLFDGTSERNNFRGSKLGFWAKTNGLVKAFKVSMYSQTQPRNATKDNSVRSYIFEQTGAIGDWKHFEVDLNPNLVYYGFLIFMEKNLSTDSYLYIDDVEVYTANPHAKYVEPATPVVQTALENGQVFAFKAKGIQPMILSIGKEGACTIEFTGSTREVFDGTYTASDNRITFDFGGGGELYADVNEDFNKLTVVGGSSGYDRFFPAGTILEEMDVLDNAERYTESGKMYYQNMTNADNRSGARGAYYCDYYSGGSGSAIGGPGWSLMGGNGDQLSLETNAQYVHRGANSLKLKRNKGAAMRYSTWGLQDGSSEGHTGVSYFMYYVKNPNDTELTLKTSVYYQAMVTPSTQTMNREYLEKVIPANSDWVQVTIPLDPAKTYYGVAYTAANISGGNGADYFYIDDATFFTEEMNIASTYGVCKDLVLSGTVAGGSADATITFDESNKVVIAIDAMGISFNSTFSLIEGVMTIKMPPLGDGSGTTVVGTYAPSTERYTMKLTITSVTGDFAPYIDVNSVFSGVVPTFAD